MNLDSIRFSMARFPLKVLALSVLPVVAETGNEKLKFGAAAWSQYGQIAKSLDTAGQLDPDNKGMLGTGAQFAIRYQANERLRISAGLGVGAGHYVAAGPAAGFYSPMGVGPYVAEASAEWNFLSSESSELSIRAGLFPFDYAPEAQNLGLYLFRGPVYPGLLTSGFETKNVLPVANTTGFHVHNRLGSFEHDFLLTFDTEWYPYWDVSPSYLAAYHVGKHARIGGGFQLYHFIPADSKLTSPEIKEVAYVDSRNPAAPETTYISFKGIKLMANFAFDPKFLFGWEEEGGALGSQDLTIYGELAVLGLDGDKAHNEIFGPVSKRMPMMVGFNIPAFKVLDRLNVEIEYYSAPWVDDPSIYNHTSGRPVTPIPKVSALDTNTTKDNLKWSVYGSRTFADHVKLSCQIASDHFRPGFFKGYGDANPPLREVPFFSPSEWYWMAKVAYFF